MTGSGSRHVVHLTTTDMSLELLLGPQLTAFVEAGWQVTGVSAAGPFVPAIEARGVTFVGLEHSTRSMSVGSDLRAMREVYELFRRLRPDVVHTHNPKPGIYGRIAARLARVPAVVNTVHGLYAQPTDPLRRRGPVYALERLAATCSDAELIQNPEDLDTLRGLRVPASKLTLLGNGVDLTRFGPAAPGDDRRARLRGELGITDNNAGGDADVDDTVVVGVVGRLVAEKGYHEVFEAARIVRDAHPDVAITFVVIGPHEPDKADALDELVVARARSEGVVMCGHRDDVEDLYQAMDLYVLASYREGFPRSAMEAAASGLPIVATDIRGCRQVVEPDHNGLLVPARDARALAEAIARLATDPTLRARMRDAALTKAQAEFDDRRQVQITLDTYERLLATRGAVTAAS
ncbi:MAG: glycosyltransferase family 4 protein [Acidimicrobiales bacterium]